MTTVSSWTQNEFLRPNQEIWRRDGDFHSLDNFLPSLDGLRLIRAPSWSDHITYPTDFKEPLHVLYDGFYDNIVVIGSSTAGSPDVVGSFYLDEHDLSKSAVQSLTGVPTDISNMRHKEAAHYVFDTFWFIGSDGDVYEASNPYDGTAATKRYTGTAYAIIPCRDTVHIITSTDEVLRWNDDTSTFESYYSNWLKMNNRFFTWYRDEIVFLGFHIDGSLCIYSVDQTPPVQLSQLARLPGSTYEITPDTNNGRWGTPWALYDGHIYFSPGAWLSPDSTFEKIPVYRYTGAKVEHVDTVDVPVSPYAWGLTTWQERLILYFIGDSDQRIYVLHRGRFVQVIDTAYPVSNDADLYAAGSYLVMLCDDDSANAGLRLTRNKADGVFTSSWVDMGHPASQKHLSRLSCQVGNPTADFKVKIEYRTEDGAWTEAVETDDARYVSAGNLGVTFYLLQIRVTFTEEIDPKTYPDVTLESVAATYSYGVR
jgi:hypothetical protein